MKIGNLDIGPGHRPIIIAEIGINHNGNLETAKTMVKKAIDSGADIIKHQTHIVEDEMTDGYSQRYFLLGDTIILDLSILTPNVPDMRFPFSQIIGNYKSLYKRVFR